MRKLSRKLPIRLSVVAFSMPGFYLFFRMDRPDLFRGAEFAGKLFAAVFFSVLAWCVYGASCLLARKPTCPKCGERRVAEFLYGIPKITGELERDVEAERIILGGVTHSKDSVRWYCNNCQNEW